MAADPWFWKCRSVVSQMCRLHFADLCGTSNACGRVFFPFGLEELVLQAHSELCGLQREAKTYSVCSLPFCLKASRRNGSYPVFGLGEEGASRCVEEWSKKWKYLQACFVCNVENCEALVICSLLKNVFQ